MKKSRTGFAFLVSLAFLGLASILQSCSPVTADQSAQALGDFAWRPNGGLAVLVDNSSQSSYYQTIFARYALASYDATGRIQQTLGTPGRSDSTYFPGVFASPTKDEVVLQLGSNIYRVSMLDGTSTLLKSRCFLLGVSPDLRIIATTTTGATLATMDVLLTDISTPTPRRIALFYVPHVFNGHTLFVGGGRTAYTTVDSLSFFHVMIFDSLGAQLKDYQGAEVPFHVAAYAPASDILFFRSNYYGIQSINLATDERKSVIGNEEALSFDVTDDGKLGVYVTTDTNLRVHTLKAINIATRNTSVLAQDAVWATLNPDGTRVAYAHKVDDYHQDIQVIGASLP